MPPLPDSEVGLAVYRFGGLGHDVDPGVEWTPTTPIHQLLHCVVGPFDHHFHGAVREVLDPTGQAKLLRLGSARPTKPNTLHTALDNEVSSRRVHNPILPSFPA